MDVATTRLPFPARVGNPPNEDAPWSRCGVQFWGMAMVRAARLGYADCLAAMLAASAAGKPVCIVLRQDLSDNRKYPESYTTQEHVPVYPATEPVRWMPYTYTYRFLPLNLAPRHLERGRKLLRVQEEHDGCVIPAMGVSSPPHEQSRALDRFPGYKLIDLKDVLRVRTRETVLWEHENAPVEVSADKYIGKRADVAGYVIRLANGKHRFRTTEDIILAGNVVPALGIDPAELVPQVARKLAASMLDANSREWAIITGRRYR